MKKVLFVLAVAVLFALSGCAAAPGLIMMAVTNAGVSTWTKSAQERKADKCAEIDTQAEKDKVSRIERYRRLTAADCPV